MLCIPEDIAAQPAPQGDLSRVALEGLAIEAYREGKLSAGQMRRLLGYRTRVQVQALLKEHGVFLHYARKTSITIGRYGKLFPLSPSR